MKTVSHQKRSLAKLAGLACMLLIATGCQWGNPANRSGGIDSGDSTQVELSDYETLQRQHANLQSRYRSMALDLTKSRAAFEQQKTLNRALKEELEYNKSNLDYVETQFVSFERRMMEDNTKAAAVSAIAEVKLLLDKMSSETEVYVEIRKEVEDKLASAEQLTRKRNFNAAVYYANRAMRILNQTERRQMTMIPEGVPRVVAVRLANLREGPGSSFKVVSSIPYGTVLVQIDEKKDWFQVRTPSGNDGWIHRTLLR